MNCFNQDRMPPPAPNDGVAPPLGMETMHVRWAGSEVSAVRVNGHAVVIGLSAAHAVSRGEPGSFSGVSEGHLLGVECEMPSGQVLHADAHCFGTVASGRVAVGGAAMQALAYPSAIAGPVELEWAFANGALLVVRAAGLVLRPTASTRFIESMAC